MGRRCNCPWLLGKIERNTGVWILGFWQVKSLKKKIISSFLSGFISSRLFLPRQHLRHSTYSESKVLPAAGTQHCQFKSRWKRSCHETIAAAKPYHFWLLSQSAVTQAAGTRCCWHLWFPAVGKPRPCCCSLMAIWQMLIPVSFIPLSLCRSWAHTSVTVQLTSSRPWEYLGYNSLEQENSH